MANNPICYECAKPGECLQHWTDDDGVTQHCAMPVDGDNSFCECAAKVSRKNLACTWCEEPVSMHNDDCRIVLRKEIAELRKMLVRVMWLTDLPMNEGAYCVFCNGAKPHHVPGCELAALIDPPPAAELGLTPKEHANA